ncbi:MAG: thiamine biosynthesis protein ApbE [Flavobacteriales bacterium]|nr:MAG: thiamine biosynthesis protein ApbE [Flavobacteriales bacterium]
MKKVIYSAFILLLFGCGESAPSKQKIVVDGFAQGTTYSVVYISKDGVNYQRAIDSTLIAIDNSMSTYQKKSLISKFNQSDSTGVIDQLFADVFMISEEVYEATNGAFDPTVAPLVNAWGFGFENLNSTDSSTIDSLLHFVDFKQVQSDDKGLSKSKKEIMLDFNAVAQGYTVDVLADLLEVRGIQNYLVEVGGELKAKGLNMNDTLWRIGIDRPLPNLKEREIEAIVSLDNKALATSGNYRKFYEKDGMKYSHTINPKTGYPVEHNLLSVTVITDNCGYADAYATAFMVMGLQDSKDFLSTHKELEALLIYSDKNGDLQTFITDELKNYIELNPDKK